MKQKKFNRLTAFIPVRDIQETLDYYRDTLGFCDEWTMGTDGGARRDDMRVLFCQDPDYIKEINNETYWFTLIWFVDNVDDIYQEFKEERKIPIAAEIENKPWGIREFSIRDINGYLIRISEPVNP
jgi:catechol 2,3-dioxygenase-like lactoylglutathione lyase family enzyme